MSQIKLTVRKNPLVNDFTVTCRDVNNSPYTNEQSDFTRTAPGVYQLTIDDFTPGPYLPVSFTIYGGGGGDARPGASLLVNLDGRDLDPRQVATVAKGSTRATTAYSYPLSGVALKYALV